MKIGVISDTHDHMENIRKAVSIMNERNIDALIHCGDYVSPFTFRVFDELNERIKENFHGVFGNNDGDRVFLKENLGQICNFVGMELISEFDGKKIFAAHLPNEETVDAIARSGIFNIILYGHTHSQLINKYDNGVLVVNPGEACGYLSGKSTFAIVDTEKMDAEIIEI
ncbi:MAG: YfcE family phosphodiesterase [Candidatus Lokiarchaeota archaeon]|nr:YfcE family phosphodiesterase [Candidatus Lokiarchaeota archaeon]MBD3202079.1 YfcE family phosphodiesterase [Candidatus Lokiarchaeota archaeon]